VTDTPGAPLPALARRLALALAASGGRRLVRAAEAAAEGARAPGDAVRLALASRAWSRALEAAFRANAAALAAVAAPPAPLDRAARG
jgi:hypothetical protein